MKKELEETKAQLLERNKTESREQQTLTQQLTQKVREARRAQEEVKYMKVKEDLLKSQWEDIKRTTDDPLKIIIRMLNNQNTDEPTTKTSASKEERTNNPNITKDSEGWTKVQRTKKATVHTVHVRGRGKARLANTIIRSKRERALRTQRVDLTTVVHTKDYQWAVALEMTCPMQM